MNLAFPDPPKPPAQTGLILQPGAGLAPPPNGSSPALSEIINRSLSHLRTSQPLAGCLSPLTAAAEKRGRPSGAATK
jgi:hypothetical protein